jgi:superfamily I DNA/RNA helicase
VAYRVAAGTAQAGHVLAITFTRKAAGELRERLGAGSLAAEVTAGTFHSLALGQLKRWWADRRSPEPVLLPSKVRILAELAAARPGLTGAEPADLAGTLEWAAARMVGPDQLADAASSLGRKLPGPADEVGALLARYQDEKRRRRLVDFDDLLARYTQALEEDPRFAAAQRWRWRHVFVDELQDVNPLQYRLLTALLGDNDDLFVVGDPNQAIYGWNGADPGFLAAFPERWPHCEVVRLDDNHRSSPQVVALASAVLGRQGSPVRSTQPDGPRPELVCYAGDDAEAQGVAAAVVRANLGGAPWSSLAVLARTNAQLSILAAALASAGAPVRALGAAGISEALEGDDAPWTTAAGPEAAPGQDAVTVCSFHRAKGLQWESVWVCGLEAGFVPIAYANRPSELAEERRLLYVALTRAKRALHCSWARERRTASGAHLRREPSPWLPALAVHFSGTGQEEGAAPAAGPPGVTPGVLDFFASARLHLARARDAKGLPPVETDPLVGPVAERLTQWRRRLARASGVPTQVLLHDATLQLLAERRPRTIEELLTVPGVGRVKAARFGSALLEVLAAASADAGLAAGA